MPLEETPAPFREVLILRELKRMSYREITEITGMPLGTVMRIAGIFGRQRESGHVNATQEVVRPTQTRTEESRCRTLSKRISMMMEWIVAVF